MKLDFSSTNFKAKVTGWRLSIENKADTLFPAVCDTAHGITAATATADLTQLEHQDPQILARANLASGDEDSAAEHDEDNTQAIDEDHDDKFNEHRDNGVDDGQDTTMEVTKGAPGLESRTGRWLVSPAAGSEKKKWNPLYSGLKMQI